MHQRYLVTMLSLGVVLSPACSDQSSEPCSAVAVSVAPGLEPVFSWQPACQIHSLAVHLPGPGAVIWGTVSVNQTNSIASGVTYGVFPTGAAQTANIQVPLSAGTTYEVSLYRLNDSAGRPPQEIGSATFIP